MGETSREHEERLDELAGLRPPVIPIENASALPRAVRALREGEGRTRRGVARIAQQIEPLRGLHAINNQWCAWEAGVKFPTLAPPMDTYLRAHGVSLAIVPAVPHGRVMTHLCPYAGARDENAECMMAAGHGGTHRDYLGNPI